MRDEIFEHSTDYMLAFLFFDKDAFFPVGKYKALAKEEQEKEGK